MHTSKLLLIACSGEETASLTKNIYDILATDYELEHQVELLLSERREDVPKDTPKAHRHPLVGDFFADGEVQVDVGANVLKDVIRGKHVALVEHMLTPCRKMNHQSEQCVSVNDHDHTIRGFLDVVKNVETLQCTLIAPYLAYVRSHSIEKYRKRGFFQFDSLRKLLLDYQKDGLNALICIDPHSATAQQTAEELGIDYHSVNPFQSGRAINPYKLGLSGDKAKEVLKRLRPFQERLEGLKSRDAHHLYTVSVDDGTERRVENFMDRGFGNISQDKVYARIAYLDKDRISYDQAATSFKPFSQINEKNVDPEGTYIIIDDMFASGGTSLKAASIFKEHGAKAIEVWTSHAVTMPAQYEKANDRNTVDKVVCLDTVPQPSTLQVEFIPASAHLLAAELYKAHQKMAAMR